MGSIVFLVKRSTGVGASTSSSGGDDARSKLLPFLSHGSCEFDSENQPLEKGDSELENHHFSRFHVNLLSANLEISCNKTNHIAETIG